MNERTIVLPRHKLLVRALRKAKPAKLLMLRGLICKWRNDRTQEEERDRYDIALRLFDQKDYAHIDFLGIFSEIADYEVGEILSR